MEEKEMAEITGMSGAIAFGTSASVSMISWKLDDNIAIFDTTDFAAAAGGYRTRIAGLPDWSATAEGRYDTTNTAKPGDGALLTLTTTTGDAFTGTAILRSMSINTPVDGLITATYAFDGNGLLNRP
jgi:predicted secreted protein